MFLPVICPSRLVLESCSCFVLHAVFDFACALSFKVCHWTCSCVVLRGMSSSLRVLCPSGLVFGFARALRGLSLALLVLCPSRVVLDFARALSFEASL